jgi:hypothetical protein
MRCDQRRATLHHVADVGPRRRTAFAPTWLPGRHPREIERHATGAARRREQGLLPHPAMASGGTVPPAVMAGAPPPAADADGVALPSAASAAPATPSSCSAPGGTKATGLLGPYISAPMREFLLGAFAGTFGGVAGVYIGAVSTPAARADATGCSAALSPRARALFRALPRHND